MPHVLNLVDVSRWERQARLVALVAARTQDGESWTEIGVDRLAQLLDESQETARWDLELMRRLALSDRVLAYAAMPRRAPAWRIAGTRLEAVLRWRHVPWRLPRGRLLEELIGAPWAAPVAWWAVGAGQSVAPWAVESPGDALALSATRENMPSEPPTAPREPPTAPRPEPIPPGQDFVNGCTTAYGATVASDEAAGGTASSLSFKTPSLNPSRRAKSREGGREAQQPPRPELSAAEAELLSALAAQGHQVWGAPLGALLELVRSEPAALRELAAHAAHADLRRARTATAAVALLCDWWRMSGRAQTARREAVAAARAEAEAAFAGTSVFAVPTNSPETENNHSGLQAAGDSSEARAPQVDEAQPDGASAQLVSLGRGALARARRPLRV